MLCNERVTPRDNENRPRKPLKTLNRIIANSATERCAIDGSLEQQVVKGPNPLRALTAPWMLSPLGKQLLC